MPSQNTSMSIPASTVKYRQYHGLLLSPSRCSNVMTVDAPVVQSTYSALSKTLQRSWVHTVPWPVAAGVLAPVNAYSVSRTEDIIPKSHSYTTKPDNYPTTCYERIDTYGDLGYLTSGGCNASPPSLDSQRVSWLQGRAMLKFLLKVKDQKSQIAVTLAEGRQTVNMIASAARDIAGFRKKFLRRIPKKARGNERKLHSLWLEARYGWMPLYYDAYGIAKHLSGLGTSQDRWPVRAFESWESDTTVDALWPGFSWKGVCRTRTTHRYKAGVGGFVILDRRVDRELVRAGLTNPLELAWEVLPYSFVIDWFIQVGNYIEGMTALSGVSLSNCWSSISTDRAMAKSVVNTTPSYPIVVLGTQNTSRSQGYTRGAIFPSLMQVGLTDLMNFDLQKQSWKHYVDSIALLKAAFRER